MSDPKTYVVKLEEDENGDLLLPFPDALLDEMGWKEGTVLNWEINDNGQVIIKEQTSE
jgi:hypothetical protein